MSFATFLIRFLVPVPVGQADNREGPRLMCSLNVGSVTGGYPRYFRFAHFEYVPRAACYGRVPYPSSELVPLVVARVLTPVLGLAGTLNLIALGAVMCAFASVAPPRRGRVRRGPRAPRQQQLSRAWRPGPRRAVPPPSSPHPRHPLPAHPQ